MHTRVRTYIRTCTYSHSHTHTRTLALSLSHTHAHTIHTHTHIHMYVYVCIDTQYINIYVYRLIPARCLDCVSVLIPCVTKPSPPLSCNNLFVLLFSRWIPLGCPSCAARGRAVWCPRHHRKSLTNSILSGHADCCAISALYLRREA